MTTKRPALFSDNLPRDAGENRLGTIIAGPFLGRVDVQVAGGEILRRVPLSGAAVAGDVVRLVYEGGDYIAQGTRPGDGVSGSGVVLGAGGGGSGNIPNPHDLLGSNHTLPSSAASSFFASPSGSAGLPSFRAIVPVDLPGGFAGFASPSAQIGMSAINGASAYAMRADAAPAINPAITPTWSGLHTFGAGAKIDAGQSLFFGADVTLARLGANVLGLGSGDSYQSTGFVSGVTGWNITGDGDAEFNNIQARGELRAFVFKINELSATAGTFGVFYSAATAYADFTTASAISGSFTLRAKNSDGGGMLFGVGDICRVKAWNGVALVDCWFTITARANETDRTLYTATLNAGSTNAVIREGSAIVDYGPSGTGFITLSSDNTVGSTPNLTMATHAGAPWSGSTPLLRIGNLNGYGSLGAVYGIAIGNPAGAWSYWDGSAMRFRQGANDVIVLDGAANSSYFAGVVTIGTSGEIRQGTGTVGSNFTGIRLFNAGGVGYLAGYTSNVPQWYGDTDGALKAGAGAVVLDAAGIGVYAAGTGVPESNHERSYSLLDTGGAAFAKLSGNRSSKSAWLLSSGTNAVASLWAFNPSNSNEAIVSCDTFTPLIDLKINGTAQLSVRNGYVSVPTSLIAGNGYASVSGGVGAGNLQKVYSPTSGTWVNESTLILNAGNWNGSSYLSGGYSVLAFHESGQRADFIRVGAAVMDLGYDGGFGSATVRVPNALGIGALPANNNYDRLTIYGGIKLLSAWSGYQLEARDNSSQVWTTYATGNNWRVWQGQDLIRFDTSGNASKLSAGTAWTSFSDARVKNVSGEYVGGLAEVLRIRPVVYDYNGKGGTIPNGRKNAGIIAQEIREILPNTVTEDADSGLLMFDPTEITWALVNAIKELSARIDAPTA